MAQVSALSVENVRVEAAAPATIVAEASAETIAAAVTIAEIGPAAATAETSTTFSRTSITTSYWPILSTSTIKPTL